ncbi:MAG: HEPN domain-containing protein [Bacteroidota bacterium]
MEKQLYDQTLNRAYYAIFHAMRAVLALDLFDSKKHSGVIAEFNKRYIKTGIFEIRFGRIVKTAEMLRSESDYKDFFCADAEQALGQVANAREFVREVSTYLASKDVK